MSFTSPAFLIFLTVVGTANYFIGATGRRSLLLVASLVFIGTFNVASLLAVIFFTGFTFLAARLLQRQASRLLFRASLLVNGLAIVVNNYLVSAQGHALFSFGPAGFRMEEVLLVIGLSFYSLQHIAYLTDVQLKRIPAEENYLDFLWVSCYFPKFISGPLTLYQQLKSQLPLQRPAVSSMWQGLNRLLLGFFKKMVIADRLAPSVSSVFDYNDTLPGITVMVSAILFTIQLYFDFSGYCDMAIGVSRLLGVELPENFNFPLRATSVTVFWRRWHQTLIGFFTAYVFYPVSFRFRKLKKQAVALAIAATFLVSAIWHGIGFTFMAWAFCHLLYLVVELYVRNDRPKEKKLAGKMVSAFSVLMLVAFSNIFFRAAGSSQAFHLLADLFRLRSFFPQSWQAQFVAPLAVGGHQAEQFNFAITIFFMAFILVFERRIFRIFSSNRFRPLISFLILMLIFMFGVFNSGQRFIYMQF